MLIWESFVVDNDIFGVIERLLGRASPAYIAPSSLMIKYEPVDMESFFQVPYLLGEIQTDELTYHVLNIEINLFIRELSNSSQYNNNQLFKRLYFLIYTKIKS